MADELELKLQEEELQQTLLEEHPTVTIQTLITQPVMISASARRKLKVESDAYVLGDFTLDELEFVKCLRNQKKWYVMDENALKYDAEDQVSHFIEKQGKESLVFADVVFGQQSLSCKGRNGESIHRGSGCGSYVDYVEGNELSDYAETGTYETGYMLGAQVHGGELNPNNEYVQVKWDKGQLCFVDAKTLRHIEGADFVVLDSNCHARAIGVKYA